MVENLESKQAEWYDSDWKDDETSNEHSDWNRSPPSSPPPSNHSSKLPPIFNHNFPYDFKFLEIATTSCFKKVKTANKKLARLLHPDTKKKYKTFTKEE